MQKRKVIIIGAAGRDFHNFNTCYRNNEAYSVVAFTAAQIPEIAGRKYPASLAGSLYPDGIPIYAQNELEQLIKEKKVDECIFSYSDVPYSHVMALGAKVNSAGAGFTLLSPKSTMLKSVKPAIAVCAVRTGCGKSQYRIRFVVAVTDIEIVEVPSRGPYDDNFLLLHLAVPHLTATLKHK
jgi:predicted GTPase